MRRQPLTRAVLVSVSLTALLLSGSVLAAPGLQTPQEMLQQSIQHLQANEFEEALGILDQLLEQMPALWQAHYYRGMALGSLQRIEEAQQAFLQAVEINPGFADGHRMAAIASGQLGDYDTSWGQGILAQLAGADMSQHFEQLRGVSEEPADFEARLAVARVFVADMDLSDQQTDEDLRAAIVASQAELFEVQKQLRAMLHESGEFGLVGNADIADFIVVVKVRAVERNDDTNRASLEAELLLTPPGEEEVAFRRRFEIRNLRVSEITSEMRRLQGYLEEWRAEG